MSNILSAISQQKRNFGFDIIRCIAILVVVLSHGQGFILAGVTWLPSFWIIDGVDVFFVLSGFLIGRILIKQVNAPEFNLRSVIYFWKRRWYRTIPNYLLILIISLVFVYFGWCGAGWSYYKYFIFVQNIFQPNPDFFPTSWSLSVEEWAYLLLPASLLFFHIVFKKSPKKNIILFTILLFILLPFLYRLKKSFYFFSHPSAHYIYDALFRKTVATRLDAIAIGVLGAYFNFYYEKYWVKYAYVFMILGIVLFYFNSNFLSVGLYRYSIYFSVYALSILLF